MYYYSSVCACVIVHRVGQYHKNGDGTVLGVKETIYTYALNEARLTFTASEIINNAYISVYGRNLINLFSDYPIGQESILYGWEQIIKRICISKVAYTRRKGMKEGKLACVGLQFDRCLRKSIECCYKCYIISTFFYLFRMMILARNHAHVHMHYPLY